MMRKPMRRAKKGRASSDLRDRLDPIGRVELFATRGRPLLELFDPLPLIVAGGPPRYKRHRLDFSACQVLESLDLRNIIVDHGADGMINSLTTGFVHPIMRMAIGDRGTIPSDSTVPKTPVATQDALFNEVYRADLDAVVLNIGTPGVHEAQFIKTFSAAVIPLTAFSNQAAPVVNEVGLISADIISGPSFPRAPVASPAAPPGDESLYSIRCFKSVPFEAAEDIAVTIRYTIFIETA